jgi:hypothetical protein
MGQKLLTGALIVVGALVFLGVIWAASLSGAR